MSVHILRSSLAGVVFVLLAAVSASAQEPGSLSGVVLDAETGAPVSGADLRMATIGRSDVSHADGTFEFTRVPAGRHTLAVSRAGYAPGQQVVEILPGQVSTVTIRLRGSVLDLPAVVVTTGGRAQAADDVFQPTSVLSGQELRNRMEASLAGTLAHEPGIAQRYNGPAASQPVIRGLSGDRVLVLEDGNRTGDVSSSSGDHAVSVDPLGAERIEVVRGAAGLIYGSNALGGVVNVIREDVPRTLSEHLSGALSVQGESVIEGLSGAAALAGSVGDVAWRASASGRVAGDTHTPQGVLPSTRLSGRNLGAGASWVRPGSFAGLAVRDFVLDYGVPGSFNGQAIPGAHEEGVNIRMHRITGIGTAALTSGWGPFSSIELDGSYNWYHHQEQEPGGIVGTEFGQLTGSARLVARHDRLDGPFPGEGAFGLWTLARDFAVAGSNTGTRPAREYSLAGFGYEEVRHGRVRLQAGARYDWTRVRPMDTDPGDIGEVRTRDFGSMSASLSGLVDLNPSLTTGITVSRSFRTPSVEELFSDGPHLADYSYNVGNPELRPEYGLGFDVFARLALERLRAEVAVYRNQIDGFIHYLPTGRLDPRLGRFPVYRAGQADAVLRGAEGMMQWEALPSLALRAQASYVRGTRTGDDEPLPEMPPLQGSFGVRYDRERWFATADWRGAAGQDRVAENERTTPGYGLLDLGAGLRWTGWDRAHSLTLGIANVADAVWRDHLSRIRAVAPQPGRNLRLTYHVEL